MFAFRLKHTIGFLDYLLKWCKNLLVWEDFIWVETIHFGTPYFLGTVSWPWRVHAIFIWNLKSLSDSKKRKKGRCFSQVIPAIIDSQDACFEIMVERWWKMWYITTHPFFLTRKGTSLPGIHFLISWFWEERQTSRCWFQSCFHLHPNLEKISRLTRICCIFEDGSLIISYVLQVEMLKVQLFHHHRGCAPAQWYF